jgi:hypothetical protein
MKAKSNSAQFRRSACAVAVAALFQPAPAVPAVVNWIAGTGFWDVATNWSSNPNLPGAADDVFINVGGLPTVTYRTITSTVNSLAITSATFAVTSGALTISTTFSNNAATTLTSGSLSVAGAATFGSLSLSGSGVLTLNGASTVTTLSQAAGTLGGTGNVTVSGAATLTGGTISGAATTTLQGATSLSSNAIDLDAGRILRNEGTATWTGGQINLNATGTGGSGRIDNAAGGVWNAQGNLSMVASAFGDVNDLPGFPAFNNAGTFNRSGSGTATSISVAFNNSGTVNVQEGTLNLNAGGTHSGGFGISSGATLQFGGGTHALNNASAITSSGRLLVSAGTVNTTGTFSNGGLLEITSGTFNAGGNVTTAQYTQSVGTLGGTGNVTVTGAAALTGGTMTGPATTTLQGATSLSSNAIDLDAGRILRNEGTATWTGGQINLNAANNTGSGRIDNAAGGVWNAQGNLSMVASAFGDVNDLPGFPAFNNAGTFNRSGSGTATSISVAFNNSGTVNVQEGTLNLNAGGTHSGGFGISSGATLQFGGGTHALNNASAITSSGRLLVSAGTVNTTGTFSNGGLLEITSGTFNAGGNVTTAQYTQSVGTLGGTGNVTVTGAAALTGGTMTGPATTTLQGATSLSSNAIDLDAGRILRNEGTATWTGGQINLNAANNTGSGRIDNAAGGVWNAQGTLSMVASGFGDVNALPGFPAFNNAGTFNRSGSGTTTTISVAFNNSGTVNVQEGTLNLSGGSTHTGNVNIASGGTWLINGGTHDLNSGTTTVNGTFQFNNGTLNVNTPYTLSGSGTFAMGGGSTLTGPSNLTVAMAAALTSGTMTGPATTTLQGATSLSSNAINLDAGRILRNEGTATWTGGQINLNATGTGGSGRIDNAVGGVWNAQGTLSMVASGFGDVDTLPGFPAFNNAGTFNRSGSGTTTTISVAFNNSGTVNVQEGTLNLNGGSTHTGNVNIASGATWQINAGTHNLNGGATTVNGTLQLSGSTLNVNTPYTLSGAGTFAMSGGTLTGPANLTVATAALLTGGTMTGPATTTLQGASTISSNAIDLDAGRILRNEGTATWTGGQINLNAANNTGSGRIDNAVGGVWNAQGTLSMVASGFGDVNALPGFPAFNNAGTFNRSGSGSTTIAVTFNNSGTARASGGTLTLTGSVTNQPGGIFEALADATITFQSGSSITNLAGNTLTGGIWRANSVGGGTALLDIQGTNTTIAANAADIYLVGADSVIRGRTANGVITTLDQSLATNNGQLRLQQGRTFTATANSGNFTNNGLLEVSDSAFVSNTLASNGTISGFGTSTVTTGAGSRITGNGAVIANTGTLTLTQGVNLGAGSSLTSNAGATVNLSSAALASQVATLVNNGSLNLGAQNIVVTKDYTNASFGSGNTFNARANVAGAGLIVGSGVSLGLTGDVTQTGANSYSLNFGAVRGGTSKTVSFQIANTGSGADVRGALQTAAGGGSITDARLTGSGVTAGNFGPIAAGDATSLYSVTFAPGSGGPLSGQSLAVVSNFDNVAPLALSLSAVTTSLAQGNATPAGSVNLGNFRVGGSLPSQAFAVQNVTTGTGAERLGIGTVSASGNFAATNNLGSGLINPGATQASAVTTSASGAVAGLNTGVLTINYVSNGQQFDASYTNIAANTQVINLAATGFNAAQGTATPSPTVNLGNARVGGSLGQAFTVTNTAPAGAFSEDLNASFGTPTGAASGSGSISGLLAGSSSTAMSGSLNTATFGAKSGTVTINYQTAGAVGGVSNGLGTASAGNQTITLNGTVYQVAQPTFGATSINLGNVRVGGTAQQTLAVTNTNLAPGFQEGLTASIGGATAGVTAAGSFTNLAAGATNNTALLVGLNTGTSGAKNGTATVNLTTTGTGTSGLADQSIGTQAIAISGNVYQLAQGQLNTTALNFGTVQVGQSVSQTLSISNVATGAAGFVEDLNASFGAASGTGAGLISGTGSISGLLAGATNASSMVVSVNTSAAATVNGAIAVNFVSAGAVGGTSNGLGTLAVGSANFGVVGVIQTGGQVVDAANPVINTPQPIQLGNVRVGAASPTAAVSVTNQASGNSQAALSASISGNAPITATGSFDLLAPGATNASSLQVGMNTGTAGAINGTATIAFVSDASNIGGCAANCQLPLPSQNVTVTGGVYQVAQPSVPANVNLGNFRLGGAAPSQAITIGNTSNAPAGFQEGLDASVASVGGPASASGGPIVNLAQGATSNAISVGLTGAVAGANNGTVTLNLASNGTGTSGLPTLALPSAVVNVSGTGFNAAAGSTTPNPVAIGNQRVGGALSQALTVANFAPAGSFSEDLNAAFGPTTGAASTNGGSISGRLAGTSNTGSGTMAVGVDTGSSGAKSGTVTINYQTAGAVNGVSNGLAPANVGTDVITVSGNVYQLAQGQLNTTALNFGTVQVGQSVSQTLSISNVATGAAGFVEDLNASFGASTGTGAGLISGTGSISGLLAGATNASSMVVSVNTSAAATVNGAIAVNFVSAGAVNGTSNGLGALSVGSANFGVTGVIQTGGQVVDAAAPLINTAQPIQLGNVRVGAASPTAAVSVTNQATGNSQAALNASISGNAPITATGSFDLLAPGATNASSLQVGMNTGTAGAINGTATIAFVSDASNFGGCAPNCQLVLPSQNVTVTGGVYRLANPVIGNSPITIAARVGDAVAANQGVSISNSSPDSYTEGLKVSIGAVSGNAQSNGGTIANLAAGATNSSAILVGLASTATAGTTSGTVTLALASTGAGTTGAPDLALPSQDVAVNGKVYTPAVAQLNTTAVDFGIVRKGDVVAPRSVSVSNAAAATDLNDTLAASMGTVSGPFTGSGSVSGLGAGATGSGSLILGLSTGTAGVFTGSASVNVASQNPDMSDLALAALQVALTGQVNELASPLFGKESGAGSFGCSGLTCTLDFGNIVQGSGPVSAALFLQNNVAAPADSLKGFFDLAAVNDFSLLGWIDPTNLTPGQSLLGLGVNFGPLALGQVSDTIFFDGLSFNADDLAGRALGRYALQLRANVVQGGTVPEPGTLAMLLLALAAMRLAQGRRMR